MALGGEAKWTTNGKLGEQIWKARKNLADAAGGKNSEKQSAKSVMKSQDSGVLSKDGIQKRHDKSKPKDVKTEILRKRDEKK